MNDQPGSPIASSSARRGRFYTPLADLSLPGLSFTKEQGRSAYDKGYSKAYRVTHRDEIKTLRKAYYALHREERKAYARSYNAAHREKKRAYAKAHRALHPEERKNRKLKKYGLTPQGFRDLLIQQGNVCAICKTSKWGWRGPNIDHDHVTGAVRGILCLRCNGAAGMMDDNPAKARALADYLERAARRSAPLPGFYSKKELS